MFIGCELVSIQDVVPQLVESIYNFTIASGETILELVNEVVSNVL